MPPPVLSLLDRPAQYLKGVGPRRAEALARLGVHSARDLLLHIPRRYEDASTVQRIGSVQVGTDATVIGEVVSQGVLPTRSGLRIFQAVLRDGSGLIEVAWPGQPFLDRSIHKGDLLLVAGPVKFFHGRQIQPREHVVLGRADEGATAAGKVLPIYPATEGLSQRMLRALLETNLDGLLAAAEAEEVFSPAQLRSAGVPPLRDALEELHRPTSVKRAERGRRRLAYEEAFFLQLLHARAHRQAASERASAGGGIAFRRTDELIGLLYRRLPFALTEAQTGALREIFADMTSPRRMNRLLQGDVGSGKTVVALFALLLAIENGCQAALMAPTEILAEQHARTLAALLEGLPVQVTLLTGSLGAAERRAALASIASGRAPLVVGTHALIQEGVQFRKLGVAVVDEQHRFGVRQRMALAEQGAAPDVLVMSATPIPRSLALTLYGDLDLTVLDELPPGRRRIKTALRDEAARARAYDFIREQVAAGRQAYVVYPLVEESEKVDLRAATQEFERLSRNVFPELRLGLIHGQMPADEKDATMRAFVAGEIAVLVSTTVIEVGIDVANATVMLVEHAERFGLSQLHQLRGRVGRGADESYCILIASGDEESNRRLGVFVSTDDGFAIARADLHLRGMGDFFGARQHGLPDFRFWDPEKDEDLLLLAREQARALVELDPDLSQPEHRPFAEVLRARYAERERLYEVG
ncbi:MAG: ATP-dependent DNA helicase RecG [Gemmatimonadetes bacterium]|nr:ATP-dependent DNA helicase RecG [Gemmatimonadota bacterium]